MKITINNLSNQISYDVVREITPKRAIIDFDGAFVFADLTDHEGWQRSEAEPSANERALISELISQSTGFDTTTVTKEPA
jgi:hypothetical protein